MQRETQPTTHGRGAGIQSKSELVLDSSFFVAFELAHESLRKGLRDGSCLNCSQYRVLIKLAAASPEALTQKELCRMLDLKPNVMTGAIDVLTEHGFALRREKEAGARTVPVSITQDGIAHIQQANKAIIEQLYRIFPTQTAPFRAVLEAAIMAGATIEPPLSGEMSRRFFASRTLASFEVLRRKLEKSLESACEGATYSECRVLMRLGEEGKPLRVMDLSRQLRMTPATVVRACDRTEARGWTHRLGSKADRKAVYIAVTQDGLNMQRDIAACVDDIAQRFLWSRLTPERCLAIAQVGSVILADLREREERERQKEFADLKPL